MKKFFVLFCVLFTMCAFADAKTMPEIEAEIKAQNYETYQAFKADMKTRQASGQISEFLYVGWIIYFDNLKKFVVDVQNDATISVINKIYWSFFGPDPAVQYKVSNEVFVANAPAAVKEFMNMQPVFVKNVIDKLSAIEDVDDEKLVAALKKIKRHIYPKLQESDEWKSINVQLELILRSF